MTAMQLHDMPPAPGTVPPPPPSPLVFRHAAPMHPSNGGLLHTLMRVTAVCVILAGVGVALHYLDRGGYVPEFGAAPETETIPEEELDTIFTEDEAEMEENEVEETIIDETNEGDETAEETAEETSDDATVSGSGSEVTDAADQDSDDDGILDYIEVRLGTDPNSSDTDQDGFTDREELLRGSDPMSAE